MTRIWLALETGAHSQWVELYSTRPDAYNWTWSPAEDGCLLASIDASDWPGPMPERGKAMCVEMSIVEEPK